MAEQAPGLDFDFAAPEKGAMMKEPVREPSSLVVAQEVVALESIVAPQKAVPSPVGVEFLVVAPHQRVGNALAWVTVASTKAGASIRLASGPRPVGACFAGTEVQ